MANRFWVGGTAAWDATAGTKWALITGGAGGQAVPTSADDVFFDGNSGANTVTIDAVSPVNCNNLNFSGFTGTFNANSGQNINVWANLTLVNTMTWTHSVTTNVVFRGNGSNTVTTATRQMGSCTFGQTGDTGTWTLQDSWASVGTSQVITLGSGTLNTNGQTLTWGGFFGSGTNVRTLTLGNSTITVNGTGAAGSVAWDLNVATNLTVNAGTSTINMTFPNGLTFRAGGKTWFTVTVAGSSASVVGGTYTNLTITGGNLAFSIATLFANFTVTGSFTAQGLQASQRLFVKSDTPGTARTITLTNAGTFSNVSFQDITISGPIATGTLMGDAGGNTNITFDTSAQQTWNGNTTGNWSNPANWTSRIPLPQDDVVISGLSAGTITVDQGILGRNINCTGSTNGILKLGTNITTFYINGSLTMAAGMTFTQTTSNTVTFCGRAGPYTITSAGIAIVTAFAIAGFGASYALADDLNLSGSFNITDGTFVSNSHNITTGQFQSSSGHTRVLTLGTSTITVNNSAATFWWNMSATALTMTGTPSLVRTGLASATIGSTDTFVGMGATYGSLSITIPAGIAIVESIQSNGNIWTGPVSITTSGGVGTVSLGANSFNAGLTLSPGVNLNLTSATTNTVTGFNATGQNNGYVYLPGLTANYISAPNAAALQVSGDIDIIAALNPNSWAPNSGFNRAIVGMYSGAAATTGYLFETNITGRLGFLYGTGATLGQVSSTVVVSTPNWVRVTRASASGTITFYTSNNPYTTSPTSVTWTQLGATVAGTAGNLNAGTTALFMGAYNASGGDVLAAKLYKIAILSGIGGTPVFNADFTAKAFGANTFTESSVNAATVTITGPLAQVGDGRVAINSSTPGTAATIPSPSAWYVGANSVLVSGNSGLTVAVNPAGSMDYLALQDITGKGTPSSFKEIGNVVSNVGPKVLQATNRGGSY